ncbi:unnamed protein product [Notodromas monacha]|uniref:Uncharacterized protein n=1 Tax=Notodromas monacha TaxID=399045 RepID=A0A7R9GCR5_9CRUS|nr:unnamed protein product [Notodromas monacha]CAG0917737.1 unnamed protein product [Notodromas monacha]
MEKATKVLRRSGIRFRARSSGHADLNLIINQSRETKKAYKAYISAQATLMKDLQRWACREDNRSLQVVFSKLLELSTVWEEVQLELIEKMREFRTHFEMILEGERQLDCARNRLDSCDQQEVKLKKELKRLAKRVDTTSEEMSAIEMRVLEAERKKDLAQLEFGVVELAVQYAKEKVKSCQLSDKPYQESTSEKFTRLMDSPPPPYSVDPAVGPPEYSYNSFYPEPSNLCCDDISLQASCNMTGYQTSIGPVPTPSGAEASMHQAEIFPELIDEHSVSSTQTREQPRTFASLKDHRSKSVGLVGTVSSEMMASEPAQSLYPDLSALKEPDLSTGARCKARFLRHRSDGQFLSKDEAKLFKNDPRRERLAVMPECVGADPENLSGAIGGLSVSPKDNPC